MTIDSAQYVSYVALNPRRPIDRTTFPGSLPFTHNLDLEFTSPVTFFVGENGSGKSTLLEAIAVRARLPIGGGGLNEIDSQHAHAEQSLLAKSLDLAFVKQPRDRYFFRADNQANFASLLETRRKDPHFAGDPYQRYGGRSLHEMSHGEAFLSIMQHRFEQGLYLMDEPESALSPQRQLALLALMHELVVQHHCQFLIATHSPILLTFPNAKIISFDHGELTPMELEATSHYQITKGILDHPGRYWKHLAQPDAAE